MTNMLDLFALHVLICYLYIFLKYPFKSFDGFLQ